MTLPGDPRPLPPELVTVWVAGVARTKGSLEAQIAPGRTATGRRRVRMVESVRGSKDWRADVVRAVMSALGGVPSLTGPRLPCRPWTCAVEVRLCVWLPRPAVARDAPWPVSQRTGDVDKLQRNIGDALVDVGLIDDDSLIVRWGDPTKFWAPDAARTGALIQIAPAGDPVLPDWVGAITS